jgi:hypothetical protein
MPRSSLPRWRPATAHLQQNAMSAQLRSPVERFLIARALLMDGSQSDAPATILPLTGLARRVGHHVTIKLPRRAEFGDTPGLRGVLGAGRMEFERSDECQEWT